MEGGRTLHQNKPRKWSTHCRVGVQSQGLWAKEEAWMREGEEETVSGGSNKRLTAALARNLRKTFFF